MLFSLWNEIIFIFILILCNSFFAASEIAIISLRTSRIKQLFPKHEKKAKILLYLRNNPDILFTSVQIGMTIISTLASTFAGATIINALSLLFTTIPLPSLYPYSYSIAFVVVVLSISYISLIIGELIPKSLALQHTEKIALWVATPIYYFSRLISPAITFITFSKNFFLKLLGQKTTYSSQLVTEEEIKSLVKEGGEKGIFDEIEQEIIYKVFSFTETIAKEIMTPRFKVHAIDSNASPEQILNILSTSGVSRFPVYEKNLDTVVGILHNKDVFKSLSEKKKIALPSLLLKPIFVPESETVSHLLKKLQKKQQHMAIVINEYGGMEGLVTIEDILEELVGEIRDETDHHEDEAIKQIKDRVFIVDGAKTIKDLKQELNLDLPDDPEFETIAGFMLAQLQSVPRKGKRVKYNTIVFTVEKVETNRIATVKIELPKNK